MLYEAAKQAWKEISGLAGAIDSDYHASHGVHLETNLAKDLAFSLILSSLKRGCYLEVDAKTNMVYEKKILITP